MVVCVCACVRVLLACVGGLGRFLEARALFALKSADAGGPGAGAGSAAAGGGPRTLLEALSVPPPPSVALESKVCLVYVWQ